MSSEQPFISIFNDVIGPVMRGPSSSHTAGAYRIAMLARSLYGALPSRVVCAFDPAGSYAPTYLPLGVDKAFCAGLMGMDMLDSTYETAVEQANAVVDVRFAVEPLKFAEHPNTVRIEMEGDRKLTIWAKSTGGGVVEIFRINDAEVTVSGKYRDAVVMPRDPATAATQIRLTEDDVQSIARLRKESDGEVLIAEPVFFPYGGPAMASSASEFLAYCIQEQVSLGEAGLRAECSVLSISRETAMAEMELRYEVMLKSVESGFDDSQVSLAWLSPHAAQMKESAENGTMPFGGFQSKAATRAHAVMHTCNSRGVVCAAPTGGSAGVLPGVLMTLEVELGYDRNVVVKSMFAAGVVGLVMATRATFAAEAAGCQVEIGIAGAMAAAAAVDVAGGPPNLALDAAAISLQNTMGSICDPVGGGCEIPCHTRNGVAASAAFTCADLACGGYRNPINLDETIDASYDVGSRLHADFRCTARGGIAVTPSALEIVRSGRQ